MYPLVQPAGYNADFKAEVTGNFGGFQIQDVEDPYAYVEEPIVPEPKPDAGMYSYCMTISLDVPSMSLVTV